MSTSHLLYALVLVGGGEEAGPQLLPVLNQPELANDGHGCVVCTPPPRKILFFLKKGCNYQVIEPRFFGASDREERWSNVIFEKKFFLKDEEALCTVLHIQ